MGQLNEQKVEQAWIGDALLALYLRQLLLKNDIPQPHRSEAFKWFSSNKFLSGFGQPTLVEAAIGSLYEQNGLDSCLAYLDDEFWPVIQRQSRGRKFGGKAFPLVDKLGSDRPGAGGMP